MPSHLDVFTLMMLIIINDDDAIYDTMCLILKRTMVMTDDRDKDDTLQKRQQLLYACSHT